MKGQSPCDFVLDTQALLQGKGENFFVQLGALREQAEEVQRLFSPLVPALSGISMAGAVGMGWLVCSSCKVLLFLWVESNKEQHV